MKILFIPCYNCEKQIVRVIKKIAGAGIQNYFDEVIILDNCSDDNTVRVALDSISKYGLSFCAVFKNSQNVGLGGSHKLAFRYAQKMEATHIAVLHGDDQGDIADLLEIMDQNEHNKYSCCLGSRFSSTSKLIGYSKFRIVGNIIFNLIFTLLSGRIVKDLGAGINVYQVSAISDSKILGFSNDLTFNCYLLLYSISYGHSIKFFPITWREDDQISNVKLFSQSVKTLKLIFTYLFFGLKKFKVNDINFDEIHLIKQKYEK